MPITYYHIWYIQVCTVTWDHNIFHTGALFYAVSVSTDTYPMHSIIYCPSKMKKTQFIPSLRINVARIGHTSILDILVYSSIYIVHTQCTVTLHLQSGLIRLAPPTSLHCTLVPFIPVSLPPFFSLLNWQTTQAWLATPKLPQPQVNLIDIAATPAVHRCWVSTAHWETRILSLAVQVRDHWRCVSSQKQRHKGDSAHHVLCSSAGATYRHWAGDGSYSLTTPESSIGPLMGKCSSWKVLKNTSLCNRSPGVKWLKTYILRYTCIYLHIPGPAL